MFNKGSRRACINALSPDTLAVECQMTFSDWLTAPADGAVQLFHWLIPQLCCAAQTETQLSPQFMLKAGGAANGGNVQRLLNMDHVILNRSHDV